MPHPAPALALLLAVFAPVAAVAVEPWASEDGTSSLEVRGFYKTMGTGILLPSGLVEGTRALAALLAASRETLAAADGAPPPTRNLALPASGATWANTARLWGRLLLHEKLELQAGWQLGMLLASDPAFVGASTLGATVPTATARGASRRLVDFDAVLAERTGIRLVHDLDLLALKVRFGGADLTLGRQVLSWGSGRLWNPTDLLSPFAPTDLDREVRRGVDALRLSVPLASTAQLELLWLAQPALRDQGAVARAQVNVGGFDLAPSVAKYVRDLVLGFDVTGDLGPAGVHAELAWTRALDANPTGRSEQFVRAVAGADLRPLDRLVLTGEYYFNGWGASVPEGYLDVMRSDRVTRGEVFGAGRHYLGLVAAWQATELLTAQGTVIANLTDPSVMIVPALEYWAEQHVLVRVGGYVPVGRRPDPSALQRLTPSDLAQNTDALRQASRTFGLRSEYGAAAAGVFAQVAAYL